MIAYILALASGSGFFPLQNALYNSLWCSFFLFFLDHFSAQFMKGGGEADEETKIFVAIFWRD